MDMRPSDYARSPPQLQNLAYPSIKPPNHKRNSNLESPNIAYNMILAQDGEFDYINYAVRDCTLSSMLHVFFPRTDYACDIIYWRDVLGYKKQRLTKSIYKITQKIAVGRIERNVECRKRLSKFSHNSIDYKFYKYCGKKKVGLNLTDEDSWGEWRSG